MFTGGTVGGTGVGGIEVLVASATGVEATWACVVAVAALCPAWTGVDVETAACPCDPAGGVPWAPEPPVVGDSEPLPPVLAGACEMPVLPAPGVVVPG